MKKFALMFFLVWHMQGFDDLDSLGKRLQEIQKTTRIAQMDIKEMNSYSGSATYSDMKSGAPVVEPGKHGIFYVLVWAEEQQ